MRDLQERRPVVAAVAARRRLLVPAAAAAVIVVDQVTKTLALDHLDPVRPTHVVGPVYFELTYNTGAAFSMGTGVTPILEAVVIALIVGLLLFTRRATRSARPVVTAALGALLGGALSNLGDRLFRHLPVHGGVVDFIRAVGWWPVFNVADASIVISVIVVVLTWRSGE
ncbi:MAG TPA: signal peptidase II [Acidimicrobiales bacterium]|nr:signal peptidase II [Acidimicrobiales bacterium]